MSQTNPNETVIPLLPCNALAETLEFYRTLGFSVTHEQTEPYLYGAVRRGNVELHFASLRVYGSKNAFGASLVFVPAVAEVHRTFADALRAKYGKIPTAGNPRITRLQPGHTRFKVFDPTGNVLLYINQVEPEWSDADSNEQQSPLLSALENAVFLRDTYANDQAAARALDLVLARHLEATPIERARALAARAELAVAMGEREIAESTRRELAAVVLTADERTQFHSELAAADELERWLTQASTP